MQQQQQQQHASTLLMLGLLVAVLTQLENCHRVECLSVAGLQQHQPSALLGSAMAMKTRDPFLVSFPKPRGVLKMTLGDDEEDADDFDDDDDDDFDEDDGPRSCNVLGSSLCPCCDNVRETGIGTGTYLYFVKSIP